MSENNEDYEDTEDYIDHYCIGCGNPCDCGGEDEESCMACERFCQFGDVFDEQGDYIGEDGDDEFS